MSGIRPRPREQVVVVDNGKVVRLKDVIRDNDIRCRREYIDYRTGEVVKWVSYSAIAQSSLDCEPIGYWSKQ